MEAIKILGFITYLSFPLLLIYGIWKTEQNNKKRHRAIMIKIHPMMQLHNNGLRVANSDIAPFPQTLSELDPTRQIKKASVYNPSQDTDKILRGEITDMFD